MSVFYTLITDRKLNVCFLLFAFYCLFLLFVSIGKCLSPSVFLVRETQAPASQFTYILIYLIVTKYLISASDYREVS